MAKHRKKQVDRIVEKKFEELKAIPRKHQSKRPINLDFDSWEVGKNYKLEKLIGQGSYG